MSALNLRLQLDARKTVAKVKKISKPYARKIQILTVGEQRAKVMGKNEVASIFKKGKRNIKKAKGEKKWQKKQLKHQKVSTWMKSQKGFKLMKNPARWLQATQRCKV